MPQFVDLTGQRFGRLLVVRIGPTATTPAGHSFRRFYCVCDCGKEVLTYSGGLKSGHVKSCGCLHREIVSKRGATHRLSKTPEYAAWVTMKGRCNKPSAVSYPNYGARGIRVCDRWANSFAAFIEDMGRRPEGTSIDRIDNDGNYEKSNCRWATKSEQSRNRRTNVFITVDGDTRTISEWAKHMGCDPNVIAYRWKNHNTIQPVARRKWRRETVRLSIVSSKRPQAIDDLLSIDQVVTVTGRKRSTVYLDIKRGTMTTASEKHMSFVFWRREEVEALSQARMRGATNDELRKMVAGFTSLRASPASAEMKEAA